MANPSAGSDGTFRVLVTGDHDSDGLLSHVPRELKGRRVECIPLPVLDFQAIPVDSAVIDRIIERPVDWIIFASSRAVQFFSELILDRGVDFPLETQVACVGEHTAESAALDGFNADFYPTEPGSEKFLEEFEHLLSNNSVKPTVFLPAAEGGRPTIAERLKELGCDVIAVPIYRSVPKPDIGSRITAPDVERSDLIVFTSPSSFDAFTRVFPVPARAAVASIGQFTAKYLQKKGVPSAKVIPGGDFSRLGEIL